MVFSNHFVQIAVAGFVITFPGIIKVTDCFEFLGIYSSNANPVGIATLCNLSLVSRIKYLSYCWLRTTFIRALRVCLSLRNYFEMCWII